ncbi:spermidine/putrescine ABC transporter substrate-binding protein [Pandoraea pneumonica]|jgi:putative spermidine/putrescine transport system substrate-binding protein|uniref:Spermidine/putrescine ABC transporter substrate-binding protein n=1 Tax=Pandoraea pneumonica TaxID=2508299 RepID=A0A5E4REG3_9BURK|nr:ABC transporter substrate-binding protein [Pandoraea pneumonica]VVD60409.1 spermidine/putrescine ABC transporter substrate-binding protein [Pandoraea pneumonica]
MKLSKKVVMCAAALALGASSAAWSQSKTLYIGMNGGPMEKAYTSQVFPEFEKANNVKVVVVPGTSSDVLAKLLANRNSPQMHVVFLDDGVMARAISMGVCQKLDDSPVLKELYPFARVKDDMGAGVQLGMTGIGYNTKVFKEKGWAAPTSWTDFADPKFKNKVVFQSASSSTFGLHGFLALNRIWGGSETNVEPGFTKWASTVGPNVVEYIPNSAKLSEMIQTGEAAIFPLTPTAVSDLQDKNIPVAYVAPKEGAVQLLVDLCVVKNSPDNAMAQKLAQYLLSARGQTLAAAAGAYIPTNPQATVPAAMQKRLGKIDDLVKDIKTVDWDAINQRRAQWDQRWNRQIER